jgi:flavin reductase (DIM6/NTAB) family NADH-FMN oxidoreductase RutF
MESPSIKETGMERRFREIDPEQVMENPFKLIGKDYMLVTAGGRESFNKMTAAWGGLGFLWGKKVSFIVIRPTRFTYEFIERSADYSLCFFEDAYKQALMICGTRSGRDVNKVAEAALSPVLDDGPIYFEQARLVLQCRKLYFQDLIPGNFQDRSIEDQYPEKDYHRWYVGEITRCLVR